MWEFEYILMDDDWAIYDDDFDIYDGDDSVCDGENDGLLPEEIEEYNKECRMYRDLEHMLRQGLGYEGFRQWVNPLRR